MRHDRIVWRKPRCSLGKRKAESERVVERVAGDHGEATVPHHVGIERCVGRKWRATLVTRARTIAPDDIVVLDADRDRLRVAESPARRVTPTARVVVVEAARLVEPQEPAEIGKLRVKGSPEPRQKLRLDRTGESRAAQFGQHLPVEVRFRQRHRRRH